MMNYNCQWDTYSKVVSLLNRASIHFSKKYCQVYNMDIQIQMTKVQILQTNQWSCRTLSSEALCVAQSLNQQRQSAATGFHPLTSPTVGKSTVCLGTGGPELSHSHNYCVNCPCLQNCSASPYLI